MITEKLYDLDSHLKNFTARVVSCEKSGELYKIILDRTAFFAEGGGQASDRGYINDSFVSDVQIINDEIIHFANKEFCVGEIVNAQLDYSRRFSFMQIHSGEHIVSGLVHKYFGFENVGFHLGEDVCTLDFDGILNREDLDKIEDLANEKIWANVKFKVYYPDMDTLSKLEYRSKKELSGDVRIVEIEDTDVCACCAPHVNSAAEIGIIKLLNFEKLRGGTRIYFKCGKTALLDYRSKYKSVYDISVLLSSKQDEVYASVNGQMEKLEKEKQNGKKLKEKLASVVVKYSKSEEKIYFVEYFDVKELQLLADGLHKKYGDFRGVFSKRDIGYTFAFCDSKELLDETFSRFKANFNVSGGGRNGIVQGTVFDTEENIRKFFKS